MALLSNTASETARQVGIIFIGVMMLYAGAHVVEPLSSLAWWLFGALFITVGAFWRWG